MAQYLITVLYNAQCGLGDKMFKKGDVFIMECLNNPEGNIRHYAEPYFAKQGIKLLGNWSSSNFSVKKING